MPIYDDSPASPSERRHRVALKALAHGLPPHEQERRACLLYKQFRPGFPKAPAAGVDPAISAWRASENWRKKVKEGKAQAKR